MWGIRWTKGPLRATMMNPDDRMFYAKFNQPTFINQRLIVLKRIRTTDNLDFNQEFNDPIRREFDTVVLKAYGIGERHNCASRNGTKALFSKRNAISSLVKVENY